MAQINTRDRPVLQELTDVSQVSVVMTMICRNEAVNFRSNLASWFPVVDYFVFIMDTRNSDDSEAVIADILDAKGGKGAKGYKIIKNEFIGFGQARTLSLKRAWEHFPQASHVLIGRF